MLRDVDVPLNLLVERIANYDVILTDYAQSAVMHSTANKSLDEIKSIHADYEKAGLELDSILKNEAPLLLEKSSHSLAEKEKIMAYLSEIDMYNIKLVAIEENIFTLVESGDKNNLTAARLLMVSAEYDSYKQKLKEIYTLWLAVENDRTRFVREQNIEGIDQINLISVIISIIVIIFASIFGILISRIISNQIQKLKSEVEEITKGNLSINLSKSNLEEIQGLKDSINRILASMKLAILRSGMSKGEIELGEAVKAKEVAEGSYKLIFDSSKDAIMTIAPPTWKFVTGNVSALKLFGAKSLEEFTSKGPWDFSPAKQPDGRLSAVGAKEMIDKAMKTGAASFDWVHKKLDGKSFPANVLLSRINIGDSNILQATVRDLTEIKKAHDELSESEEKFRALTCVVNDAVIMADSEDKIVFWNKSAESMLGWKEKEVVGKTLHDFLPKETKHRLDKSHLKQFSKTGKSYVIGHSFVLPIVHKNGKVSNINLLVSGVLVNGKWCAIGVMRSVDDKKD